MPIKRPPVSSTSKPSPISRRIVERYTGDSRGLQEFAPAPIASVDYTDGIRITMVNGEVLHFRPSGNADELRCYAVADTQARADAIAALAVAEPDGILRRLEKSV